MTNTFTNLYPDLYSAVDTVSREMIGFIPAVARDSRAERAAVGQSVRVPVTQPESAQDTTPSNVPPDDGGNTTNNRVMTISRSRTVPIAFTGEEIQGLNTQDVSGAEDGYSNVRQDRIRQALRELVNEMETDLGSLYTKASRAYGTAGTAPFGTKDDLTDFAGSARILDDNGAPDLDRQYVGGSAAWFNLRGTQTGVLQRANEAGTDAALRNGEFGEVHGLTLRNSKQVVNHTSGSVTDVTANANAVGTTEVSVDTAASTGDISLNEGDLISFAGDSELYVVAADVSEGAGTSDATIEIREPGLQTATSDGAAVSAESDYTANMSFQRGAIHLATRIPAIPPEGDMAIDRTTVVDPVSGVAFEFSMYPQYRQVRYEVAAAWGYEVTKEEHVALNIG